MTDYYGLLPDDTDAAWDLLTASYQRQTGGRDSYEDFWGDMDSVTVSDVSATTPDRARRRSRTWRRAATASPPSVGPSG